MYKKLLPILTFARIDIKRLFRDKVAIFFVFIFPLIFLFVFGSLFGNNNEVSFKVAMINQSKTEFAREFVNQAKQDKVLKIQEEVTDLENAKEKMSRGELDAAIILPETFGVVGQGKQYPSGEAEVVYSKNAEQAGQTLASILDGIFKDINSQFVQSETPFRVKTTATQKEGIKQFDYVFSGLLGFTLLSMGIFGPLNIFPKLKQRGVLRRYHTTTLKVWQYFTGNVLSNIFVSLLSVAVMFAVAFAIFKLHMKGDFLSLAVFVIIGSITMLGIGLAIGGWARNEAQAAPLGNLVSFPMMFLSGSFFPRFLMPEWLQNVSAALPLTPINDAVRLIITEGKTVLDLLPQLGLIAAWAVVIYLIALRVFRWE